MTILWGRKLDDTRPGQRQTGARFALLVLSATALLNSADRFFPMAVKEEIKEDLRLTDAETTLPTSAMTIVFVICSLITGWVADGELVDRRLILACAVSIWSLATVLGGFAQNLLQFVLFRSLVGVGEAAFCTIVPTYIADLYPRRDCTAAFTMYFMCGPLGGAIGFTLGSFIGASFGWRHAFFVCGFPGFVVACFILFLNDPVRGINDVPEPGECAALDANKAAAPCDDAPGTSAAAVCIQEVFDIVTRGPYLVATGGLVAAKFVTAAYTEWCATFLVRYDVMTLEGVGMFVGLCTVVGGIVGVFLGSMSARYSEPLMKNAYFMVPGLSVLLGGICLYTAVRIAENVSVAAPMFLIGEVFFFAHYAPMSTVTMGTLPAHLRARASAMQTTVVNVMAGTPSPILVGVVSDRTNNLRAALHMATSFSIVSCLIWCVGARLLPPLPRFRNPDEKHGDSVGVLSLLLFERNDTDAVGTSNKIDYGATGKNV